MFRPGLDRLPVLLIPLPLYLSDPILQNRELLFGLTLLGLVFVDELLVGVLGLLQLILDVHLIPVDPVILYLVF